MFEDTIKSYISSLESKGEDLMNSGFLHKIPTKYVQFILESNAKKEVEIKKKQEIFIKNFEHELNVATRKEYIQERIISLVVEIIVMNADIRKLSTQFYSKIELQQLKDFHLDKSLLVSELLIKLPMLNYVFKLLSLPKSSINSLCGKMTMKIYEKGTYIWKVGDETGSSYINLYGRVTINSKTERNRLQNPFFRVLMKYRFKNRKQPNYSLFYDECNFFGYKDQVIENNTRTNYMIASDNCILLSIENTALEYIKVIIIK